MLSLREFLGAVWHHHHGHTLVSLIETAAIGTEIALERQIASSIVAGAAGLTATLVGAAAGTVGTWMALGAGLHEAREVVEDDNRASGYSRGFVAGLQNWTGQNVLDHLGKGMGFNPFDRNIAVAGHKAYYEGLAAGYVHSVALRPEVKKEYLAELRRFAGPPPDQSTIRARVDRVIELAAKLRANFLGS
jgi:hypothetical protein